MAPAICARVCCSSGADPELPLERRSRGPDAAHTVHAATWRSRRRAEVEPAGGRRVGIDLRHWPREQLAPVLDAAIDVAADVIRVVVLQQRRAAHGAREDAVAEAWGE